MSGIGKNHVSKLRSCYSEPHRQPKQVDHFVGFRSQQMGTQDAIGVLFDQNLEGSISTTGPAGRIPAGSVCLLGSKTQVKLPGVFFQQTHTSEGRNSEHDGRNAYVVWFHVVSPQKMGSHDLAFIAGNRSKGQSTACGSIHCCIEGRV